MKVDAIVLDKTIDTVIKCLPIPDIAETAIITVKNFLKNDGAREKITSTVKNLLSTNNFEKVKNIKEVFEEKNVKEGINQAIDFAINNAKKSKIINKETANILNSSKDLIMKKIVDKEVATRYVGQEKSLQKIENSINKWEEALNNSNTKEMEKVYKEMQKELAKLTPTAEIINKANEIQNLNRVGSAKILNGETVISDLEKEIIRKVA